MNPKDYFSEDGGDKVWVGKPISVPWHKPGGGGLSDTWTYSGSYIPNSQASSVYDLQGQIIELAGEVQNLMHAIQKLSQEIHQQQMQTYLCEVTTKKLVKRFENHLNGMVDEG